MAEPTTARTRPLKAVAYVRVSNDRQTEEGFGLIIQRETVRRFAHLAGHGLVAVHADEGVSGALPVAARPGLTAALDMIRTGEADALLLPKLDRLARTLSVQSAPAFIPRLSQFRVVCRRPRRGHDHPFWSEPVPTGPPTHLSGFSGRFRGDPSGVAEMLAARESTAAETARSTRTGMDMLSLVRPVLRTRANPLGRPLAIWGSRAKIGTRRPADEPKAIRT